MTDEKNLQFGGRGGWGIRRPPFADHPQFDLPPQIERLMTEREGATDIGPMKYSMCIVPRKMRDQVQQLVCKLMTTDDPEKTIKKMTHSIHSYKGNIVSKFDQI